MTFSFACVTITYIPFGGQVELELFTMEVGRCHEKKMRGGSQTVTFELVSKLLGGGVCKSYIF